MAYVEHIKDRKYRLCATDPNRAVRKRLYQTVEVPADIPQRKLQQWLNLELAKYVEAVESGQIMKPDKITFEGFIPKWKAGYADQNMGEYTRRNTVFVIDSYLIPEFGSVRLDQIKPLHLVTFFAGLVRKDGKPMATNTKLNIYKATKSIFDAAHRWKLIKENPMDGVDRPSASKREKKAMRAVKKAYGRDEVETLLTALYALPTRWRLYYSGVMIGGFRRGEMLAVEWSGVSREKGAIYIAKQITYDEEGNGVEGEVKTEESEGWVAMPKWYMDELQEFRREWAREKLRCKEWKGGEKQYVFHSGAGLPYYPNTPSLTWRRFLAAHDLPHVKLHGLRHTAGMLLRENGVDLKTIQERLRHTKIDTTANIYVHESDIISRAAADQLETLNPKLAPFSAPKATK